MDGALELDAYTLQRPLGRGGMARVWRASRGGGHADVAIKILAAERADERRVRALHREIRAVARLGHAHIVRPLDFGVATAEVAAKSAGHIVAGSPWFAMELARGGTLSNRLPLPWQALKPLLLGLCAALAHAHARGVVHCDLKPSNVLLATAADARPGLKLADFGIAAALTAPAADEGWAGTPAYMAPEQFSGGGSATGPWSDMYALGCLAFAMAVGRPPFRGEPRALAELHIYGDVPTLAAAYPVPEEFRTWVSRLLSKSPAQRPDCAAAAAHALREIDFEGDTPRVVSEIEPELACATETIDTAALCFKPQRSPSASAGSTMPGSTAGAWPPPPLPPTWRTPELPDADTADLGLGLVGLRPIPLVGREDERDALWRAFAAVEQSGQPQTALLRGGAGMGKSHLAKWLLHRLGELGIARGVWIRHGEQHADGDGLVAAMARALRLAGATADEATARLSSRFGELQEPAEIAQLLVDASAQPRHRRHLLLTRLAAAWSQRRSLVICIDDAHWGADSLEWLQSALEQDASIAALIIVIVRDEILSERAIERRIVDELRARNTVEVDLGPLAPEPHRALIKRLLGFRPDAAQQIAERTQGHPQMAVALVHSWVAQHGLVAGRAGFHLAADSQVSLPTTLLDAWSERLERLLRGRPLEDERALEIAAALGRSVHVDEWEQACVALGITRSHDLLLALQRAAVAHHDRDDGVWRWAPGPVREAVLDRCGSRRVHIHRAIADVLDRHWRTGEPGAAVRLGQHLLQAGALDAAYTPLNDAYTQLHRQGEISAKISLLRSLEVALQWPASESTTPHADERTIHVAVRTAGALTELGDLDEALRYARIGQTVADRMGRLDLRARALHIQGAIHRQRLELQRASACFSEAVAADIDERTRAMCMLGLGIIEAMRGQLSAATKTLAEALAVYARVDPIGRCFCLQAQAYVARSCSDLGEAERLYSKARRGFEQHQMQMGIAFCLDGLGDVERAKGHLEQSTTLLQEALAMLERIGSGEQTPRFNLALTLLMAGRTAAAAAVAERGLRISRRHGQATSVVHMRAVLAGCALEGGEATAARAHLNAVTAAIKAGYLRLSVAEALDVAAEHAPEDLRELCLQSAAQVRDGLTAGGPR